MKKPQPDYKSEVAGLKAENKRLRSELAALRRKSGSSVTNNESLLRLSIEHAPAAIAMFDREMRYILASRRFIEDYHLADRDIIGKSHYDVFPELPDRLKEIHRRCLAGATEKADSEPFLRADGRTDYVRWAVHPWHEPAGTIGGLVLFTEVVTDLVKRDEELRKKEEQFRFISQNTADIIWIMDPLAEKFTYVSASVEKSRGYTPEEVMALPVSASMTPASYEEMKAGLQDMIRIVRDSPGQTATFIKEVDQPCKDGSIVHTEATAQFVINQDGKVEIVGVSRDITEKKKVEELIRLANEKMKHAQRIAHIGSWDNYLPTGELTWSDEMYRIMGVPVGVPVNLSEISSVFPPEELERFSNAVNRALKDREPYSMDYRIIRPDGAVRYIHDEGEVIRDKNGTPVRMVGATQDITDRKLYEEALRRSEEKYRNIFETIQDIYYESTLDGIILDISPSIELTSGGKYRREELIGLSYDRFFVDPGAWDRLMSNIIQDGRVNDFELMFRNKDGTQTPVSITAVLVRDKNEHPLKIVGSIRDISRRKVAEDSLRSSEELFRALSENSFLAIGMVNASGKVIWVNDAMVALSGYSREEFYSSSSFAGFLAPESIQHVIDNFERFVRQEPYEHNYQMTIARVDGKKRRCEVYASQITGPADTLLGIITLMDITDREEAETALKQREEDLNYAQEIARMGSWEFSLLNERYTWSRNNYLMAGMEPFEREVTVAFFMSMVHPDDLDILTSAVDGVVATHKPAIVNIRIILPDGSVKWLQNNVVAVVRNGMVTSIKGVNIDITSQQMAEQEIRELNARLEQKVGERTRELERSNQSLLNEIEARKRTEAALSAKSAELENFFDVSVDFLCILDFSGRFHQINKAWKTMFGITDHAPEPAGLFDLVHPDDLNITKSVIRNCRKSKLREFSNRIKTLEGDYRFIEWHIAPSGQFIFAAARDITMRRRTEIVERELLNLSVQLTGIPAKEIGRALSAAVFRIGKTLAADRAYVFELDEGEMIWINTAEWCEKGIKPGMASRQTIGCAVLPEWRNTLFSLDRLIIPRVRSLPEKWRTERAMLEGHGVQSVIAVPLVRENQVIGFVALDSVNGERRYSDSEVNIIKVWANLLSGLINYQRSEEIIEQMRNNYDTFFNTIDDFLIVVDEEWKIIYTNDTVFRRMGYTLEEIQGHPLSCVHPADRIEDTNQSIQSILNGQTDTCTIPLVTKSGEYIPVETKVKRGFWNGRPVFFTVTKDLSAVQLSEEKFSHAFHSNTTLMSISNEEKRFVDVNEAFIRTLGFSREEILGHTASELGLFPEQDIINGWIEKSKQGISTRDAEAEVRSKGGGLLSGLFSVERIFIGKDPFNLVMMVDITERKRAEEEVRQAKAEADLANQAKSEFLSRMSHELRTPMNSILGFAQLLELTEINAVQKKNVSHILTSGKHLLNLINEVLDIARIESGRMVLSLEPVQLGSVIGEMMDVISPVAEKQSITLKFKSSPWGDSFIHADRQRLKQVILNLLGNAVKYNREGGSVNVSVSRHERKVSNHRQSFIRVSVIDTGVGIARENFSKLFVPFERIDPDNRATEGTGLGLAVVGKLIEAMGGIIGVSSEQGKGSTFWFELPLVSRPGATAPGGEEPESGIPARSGFGTILYIEDNSLNVELVASILTDQRPLISLVSSDKGMDARWLALAHHPDLILLDLDLPDIHGTKVLDLLKSDEILAAIPVVIISAEVKPRQTEQLLSMGARYFLPKPLDLGNLLMVIDEFIPENTQ